ncbi:cell division protein CrgA [Streptomyces sp. TRM70350]|uniref:cell division protein CrgA n=1 Tax=Streptomyces sp. TRM70350 TaxID=2856165 RepID=UPI001C464F94|nr:cell division protein CrgA [Streptomyces sp. TRM70350]MBV7696561.1 cell division protein CrgA [Streptomyces sp. TRM70350]
MLLARKRAAAGQARTSPAVTRLKREFRWTPLAMAALLSTGLTWIVLFYLTQGRLPVHSWGNWNLGFGIALLVTALCLSARWR